MNPSLTQAPGEISPQCSSVCSADGCQLSSQVLVLLSISAPNWVQRPFWSQFLVSFICSSLCKSNSILCPVSFFFFFFLCFAQSFFSELCCLWYWAIVKQHPKLIGGIAVECPPSPTGRGQLGICLPHRQKADHWHKVMDKSSYLCQSTKQGARLLKEFGWRFLQVEVGVEVHDQPVSKFLIGQSCHVL